MRLHGRPDDNEFADVALESEDEEVDDGRVAPFERVPLRVDVLLLYVERALLAVGRAGAGLERVELSSPG